MAKPGMRDAESSLFVANLDSRVSEEILWELFLQAGPVNNVHIPLDKDTGRQKTFAFVEFSSSASAHYAWELLDGIMLYNRPLTVRPQNSENAPTPMRVPSKVISAADFYKDFYQKYEDLKRRPQSEPRRNQWNGEYRQQANSSFSHPTFHRSLSSPANSGNNASPQLQQLLSIINTSGWNNCTPQSSSTPQLRLPYRSSLPYAGSPPYAGSSPYAGSPPYAGSSSSYGGSTPYSRSVSSNSSNRSSAHGYRSPSQDQYRDSYRR